MIKTLLLINLITANYVDIYQQTIPTLQYPNAQENNPLLQEALKYGNPWDLAFTVCSIIDCSLVVIDLGGYEKPIMQIISIGKMLNLWRNNQEMKKLDLKNPEINLYCPIICERF